MASVSLDCDLRERTGSGESRRLRRAGNIPAVVYGPGDAPMSLTISKNLLSSVLRNARGGNVLIDLKIPGRDQSGVKSIIREIQRDPITGGILHVDFQHVSLTRAIVVEVQVVLKGIPFGVSDSGGILEHILRTVEVECLPTDIPERFEVDVSTLSVGDSLHVRDIVIENGKIISDGDSAIATVVPPTVFEEAKVEAAPTEPELIAKASEEEVPEDKEEKEEK